MIENSFLNYQEAQESKLLVSLVLRRYEHQSAYNVNDTIFDFCKKEGVDIRFLTTVFDAFCDEDFFPTNELRKFSKEVIIDYLLKTHHFYINRLIPEIQQNFNYLILQSGAVAALPFQLLEKFDEYHQDLLAHIEWEEKELFVQIQNGNPHINLEDSEKHHQHELALHDIIETLLANFNHFGGILPYSILIEKLKLLAKDISIHARIEDEVLLKINQSKSPHEHL